MSRISGRKAIIWAVALFVLVPIAAQPIRPWLVSLPLPKPTLWQSITLFVGQFLVFGLVVWVYNLRQANQELRRERDRVKYASGGMADD